MVSLKAKIRENFGRKTKSLRKKGVLPAILYGIGIDNLPIEVDEKEFEEVYKEAGGSSLISLEVDDKKYQVLIHGFDKDPLRGKILHVDFYHPSSYKEVTAEVSLVFEGEEEIQKSLSGNLIKEIQAVEVKGLPQDLPKEIKVDLTSLGDVGDKILIKDLKTSKNVKILKNPEEVVAVVVAPEKFEEEEKIEEEKLEEKSAEEKAAEEEKVAEAALPKEKTKEKSK